MPALCLGVSSTTNNSTVDNSTVIWKIPDNILYGTNLSDVLVAKATNNITEAPIDIPTDGSIKYYNGSTNDEVTKSTILGVGTYTLNAEFTPTNSGSYKNYRITSVSVPLNVTKAPPNITWNNPADIIVGASLGSAQLNAVAKDVNGNILNGTFAYTPSAGTIFVVGQNQLAVSFTPNDTVNYTSPATKTASVNVTANPTMNANFTASVTNGSAPLSVVFTDTTTGQPINRVWLFGDGTYQIVPGSATTSHTYTVNGSYDITLYSFNTTTFAQAIKPKFIVVGTNNGSINNSTNNSTNNETNNTTGEYSCNNSSPDLVINDIWADKTTGTAPLKNILHCSVTTNHNIASYNWTFENPGPDYYSRYGADSAHTFKNAGVFNITLDVVDSEGNTATYTKYSYVTVLPANLNVGDKVVDGGSIKKSTIVVRDISKSGKCAQFGYMGVKLMSGTKVHFFLNTIKSKSVSWNFGDGHTAKGSCVVHTYDKKGTYTVTEVIKKDSRYSLVIKKKITIK